MSNAPEPEINVVNNEATHRYEVQADGTAAGFLTYRLTEDRVVFEHAEIYPRFEGRGVGSALAKAALDDVIEHGKTITPKCPFVADYLARHPAYLRHTDEGHRAEIEARIATEPENHEVA